MNSFILGDVEVTNINPVLKSFSLLVHVKAAPMQMASPEVHDHMTRRVQYAVKYLLTEGFIDVDPYKDQWTCEISGVCHPI